MRVPENPSQAGKGGIAAHEPGCCHYTNSSLAPGRDSGSILEPQLTLNISMMSSSSSSLGGINASGLEIPISADDFYAGAGYLPHLSGFCFLNH
jgi:hypothetical protein